MRSNTLAGCVLLSGLFFWCASIVAETFPGPAEIKAMQIAEDYVAANFKGFVGPHMTPRLKDEGDYWMFYYDLPRTMIGGGPVVHIDKRSFKVIRSYMTQ